MRYLMSLKYYLNKKTPASGVKGSGTQQYLGKLHGFSNAGMHHLSVYADVY